MALIAIVCIYPHFALAQTSNITSLVFTTNPTSVGVGDLSGAITVQTQNSSGSSEQVDETNDVTFTSSSASGSFLNSSGDAVSTTMSKNTASRTFYYKDSTAGTYTLSVSIKGRTSGTNFSATQDILVGTSSGGGSTTTDTTSGSSGSGSSSNSDGSLSAHSEQDDISSVSQAVIFKAGVGRERIVSVHAPLDFRAITTSVPTNYAPSYAWSFGDGTTGNGEYVTHRYDFAGDYNLVLNVSAGNAHAVARTKVKVVMPDIKILNIQTGGEGFVELKNSSPYEVNIEGWHISAKNGNDFVFPKDTIISAKANVKFPFILHDTALGLVSLSYPDRREEAHYDLPFTAHNELQTYSASTSALDSGIDERMKAAKERLVAWQNEWAATHNSANTSANATTSITNTDQTEALVNAMKSEQKDSGMLSAVVNAPTNILHFFKGLFGGNSK